jgi:hypothetical protein
MHEFVKLARSALFFIFFLSRSIDFREFAVVFVSAKVLKLHFMPLNAFKVGARNDEQICSRKKGRENDDSSHIIEATLTYVSKIFLSTIMM